MIKIMIAFDFSIAILNPSCYNVRVAKKKIRPWQTEGIMGKAEKDSIWCGRIFSGIDSKKPLWPRRCWPAVRFQALWKQWSAWV